MLLYHQAFDFHHALFRILVLLDSIGGKEIEPDKLRILDFYFLFPHEIGSIDVNRLQLPLKRKFAKYPQYEAISNPAKVFYRLEPVFDNSLKSLAAAGFVETLTTEKNVTVRLASISLPQTLRLAIENRKTASSELLAFLVEQLFPYPFHGKEGLKARTNLLPSKYDRR